MYNDDPLWSKKQVVCSHSVASGLAAALVVARQGPCRSQPASRHTDMQTVRQIGPDYALLRPCRWRALLRYEASLAEQRDGAR